MTFADLLAGEAVFLDANTLVYHFVSDPVPLIADGARLSRQTGLLSNDALIAAVMHANGLTKIATSDQDFDRVPGLTRYEPV